MKESYWQTKNKTETKTSESFLVSERFVFRQVHTADMAMFAADGELRAKNHECPQACHQTSYADLVNRRGTDEFRMPCGGVVNDYVPFYFSPVTAFCFAIHQRKVELKAPSGETLRKARKEDRCFIVYRADDLIENRDLQTFFSNTSLNNRSIEIEFGNALDDLEKIVSWKLFDDDPMIGKIPEIGYGGCCRWFHNRDTPEEHQDRKQRRMAELLVHESVPLNLASAVVVQCEDDKVFVEGELEKHNIEVPVIIQNGCFI